MSTDKERLEQFKLFDDDFFSIGEIMMGTEYIVEQISQDEDCDYELSKRKIMNNHNEINSILSKYLARNQKGYGEGEYDLNLSKIIGDR